MRSVVCVGTVLAAAIAAAACSDSSSGPNFNTPAIAGTYTGTVTYQTIGDSVSATPVTPNITIQMNDANGSGNFTGTFGFSNGFTGIGTIAGQFSSDGSTVNWIQFGDANEPLFFVAQFLQVNFPDCNLQGSTFTLNPNGGFDLSGGLTLQGTYSGVRCLNGVSGADSVLVQMNVSLDAFNPAPFQKTTHGMAADHSVLRGGVMRVK